MSALVTDYLNLTKNFGLFQTIIGLLDLSKSCDQKVCLSFHYDLFTIKHRPLLTCRLSTESNRWRPLSARCFGDVVNAPRSPHSVEA